MTTIDPPAGAAPMDDFGLDESLLAPPPRRRKLPVTTALLVVAAAIGVGVVGGVLIQKHWGSSGSATGNRAAAFAALRGGAGGSTGATRGAFGNFARSGTVGQVKAIDGNTLYVTDVQGNVVKVTTTGATQVRVTKTGSLRSVRPGDNVVIQGQQTKAGYAATSVTDSGTQSGGFGGLGGFGGAGGAGGGSSQGFGQQQAPTGFGGKG